MTASLRDRMRLRRGLLVVFALLVVLLSGCGHPEGETAQTASAPPLLPFKDPVTGVFFLYPSSYTLISENISPRLDESYGLLFADGPCHFLFHVEGRPFLAMMTEREFLKQKAREIRARPKYHLTSGNPSSFRLLSCRIDRHLIPMRDLLTCEYTAKDDDGQKQWVSTSWFFEDGLLCTLSALGPAQRRDVREVPGTVLLVFAINPPKG